ncbi:hypothetical protein ACFT30_02595 [Microbacterium ureisolvens]|uniref:hypothetical protein n=1 Tax=Microbacterium ureisolvens TaxID=2781186 RepID=UPI003643A3F6
MTDVATKPRPGSSLRGFSAPLILITGLVIVPFGLALLFNSYTAPDDEAYVRMAFASVAGATVAITAVLGLLIDRIVRRASISTIAIFAVIALVVVPWQLAAISSASDLLLARLGL